MELNLSRSIVGQFVNGEEMGAFILGLQKESGEIPWSEGGKTDPWDHVESAMGLAVAGYVDEARRAYEWMRGAQLDDGSWWAEYRDGVPADRRRDANFSSYIAVGVFHHYLLTNDHAFLREMWSTVSTGIDFALSLQAPTGEIYWSIDPDGVVDRMALLTGSSSIYMSIKCALAIASRLGEDRPDWRDALERLGNAIRTLPNHFNMIKSRYSMDWYYPVLCGAVSGTDAHKRIDKSWDKFVEPGWGVRCVSDRPWATMAETSELVLALMALERVEEARVVFRSMEGKCYDDGSYWMGVTFPDAVIWPEERTSWTTAAVLLAYDTLNGLTPASCLFNHAFWREGKNGHAEEPRLPRHSWIAPPVERLGG